jgi:RNA polymerase sigma factor (TIGR02999 family)
MQGETAAADPLLRELLPKLREIARRELRRERFAEPLSKTELIHELWLGSLSRGGWEIRDRGHFFALASLAMRRILVDMARKRLTARRGGGGELAITGAGAAATIEDAGRIVEIGILMDRLEESDPDAARVVDMHYFSGFTIEEIARETGLTPKQARTRWERGMKHMRRKLLPKPAAIPHNSGPGKPGQ